MADKFRALLVTKDGDRQSAAVTELTDADLMEGDVTVAVEHSTVNYKDGLAITGKAPPQVVIGDPTGWDQLFAEDTVAGGIARF